MAYMKPIDALFWILNPNGRFVLNKKFGFRRSGIILFSAMSTGSHIIPTGNSLCFLEMARGPDLPVVTFSQPIVIYCLLPLDYPVYR